MNEKGYCVDLVLCIDCTSSMGNLIGMVKDHAMHIDDDIRKRMLKKKKRIAQMRVRVIEFRDFYEPAKNGEPALAASDFFSMPEDRTRLKKVIDPLKAIGGGSAPESGLEALALAIQSPWLESNDIRRQVIVLWTDASAHPLEKSKTKRLLHPYPKDMPPTFDDLTDLWEQQDVIDPRGRRLLLFAPPVKPWNEIARDWEETQIIKSHAGHGLSDVEYTSVIDTIAQSIIIT